MDALKLLKGYLLVCAVATVAYVVFAALVVYSVVFLTGGGS